MDPVILSRVQFAITVGFHFIFPSITIGLAWLIVYFMTRYKNASDEDRPFWKGLSRFWVKVFAVAFAIGVASGITMEFQFGTNWATYSRFVGDIFGAPLAAEALIAFFLESTFLGVLLLGWKKVSVKVHWISSIMVAFGSTLSAFWILVANSWQQTPAGFEVVDGRAQLTDFYAAIFNASTWPRFFHTVDACLICGAFFVMGISAIMLLRNHHVDFARTSLKTALVVGFVASALQLPIGHWHGVQVAHTQPAKLAAIEGHFETQKNAPGLIFGLPDYEAEETKYAIKVPGALSLLAFGSLDAEVKGLKDYPKDEWPPLYLTFFPFHLMVMLGTYFVAFTGVGLVLWKWGRLFDQRLFLKIAVFSIPLPVLTNELGWITAEVGRQPWVVYEVLKTKDAVSISVPASQILFTIIMFSVIYALLFAVWMVVLRKQIAKGPEDGSDATSKEATT